MQQSDRTLADGERHGRVVSALLARPLLVLLLRDRTRVSSQLQQGLSIGFAALPAMAAHLVASHRVQERLAGDHRLGLGHDLKRLLQLRTAAPRQLTAAVGILNRDSE